jgi:hypothetical protein
VACFYPREFGVKDPIFNNESYVNDTNGSGLEEVIATGVA